MHKLSHSVHLIGASLNLCCVYQEVEKGSGRVADGTKAQDSVWSVRDQRYRDTQDSELSLTLLCYTDAQDHESTDQTSDCNAGEQQTPLKMCSVKLEDCRNLIESREEETTAEQQQQSHEEDEDYENNGNDEDENYENNGNDVDDGDFFPSGMFLLFMTRYTEVL